MLAESLAQSSILGAVLISLQPSDGECGFRLENLMKWCDREELIPFFWVDPAEPDAKAQMRKAIEAGVRGFKIICDSFYPGDSRCLDVCELAADADRPVLFHSGILWDGKPSSEFCRPVHFEHLLTIDNLRFSLAHIGWPWCDEMIAVFGKFLNFRSLNPSSGVEMYIDMTPGTPFNYRQEVLEKLFMTGYDIKHNLIFGSDCNANGYNTDWVMKWMRTDKVIYSELGIDDKVQSDIYYRNLMALIDGNDDNGSYERLVPAAM